MVEKNAARELAHQSLSSYSNQDSIKQDVKLEKGFRSGFRCHAWSCLSRCSCFRRVDRFPADCLQASCCISAKILAGGRVILRKKTAPRKRFFLLLFFSPNQKKIIILALPPPPPPFLSRKERLSFFEGKRCTFLYGSLCSLWRLDGKAMPSFNYDFLAEIDHLCKTM